MILMSTSQCPRFFHGVRQANEESWDMEDVLNLEGQFTQILGEFSGSTGCRVEMGKKKQS